MIRRSGLNIIFTAVLLATSLSVIVACGGGGDSGVPSSYTPGFLDPPAWGTAVPIGNGSGTKASSPQIAFDSYGNAIAVWYQYDAISSNLWTNYYDGTAWGTAELIEVDDTGDVTAPQIAFDGSGHAMAVWQQSDGIRENILSNYFNGVSWGTAELIETDNAGDARNPCVAFDGSGHAIVVWYQSDGIRDNIRANYFNGVSWGVAELIETDNAGDAHSPHIAFDGSGHAIAVWQQSDGTQYSIWGNYFDGADWRTAVIVETNDAGDALSPKIAFDGTDNAIIVWHQNDGTRDNIWAVYFNGVTLGTPELIETDNAGNAQYPKIAMDAAGHAIAVWTQSDGTHPDVWANYFDGTSWSTAELLETDDAGYAQNPQIAFNYQGRAMAVWQQSDGTRYNIWANYFDGTAWGAAELIETGDGNAFGPQIAFDGGGNAVAVWAQDDGTRYGIWANVFE